MIISIHSNCSSIITVCAFWQILIVALTLLIGKILSGITNIIISLVIGPFMKIHKIYNTFIIMHVCLTTFVEKILVPYQEFCEWDI